MTVKELIEHLNQFDSETKVMFSHIDHTDWLYKVDMDKENISLGNPVSDDLEGMDELPDGDFEYTGPQVLLFELDLNN